MFNSKAETLIFLEKKIKLSKIPKTFYFSVYDWKKKEKVILQKIKKVLLEILSLDHRQQMKMENIDLMQENISLF